MRPIHEAGVSVFARVRFVLTDMDETLTYRGRLAAATYHALERLQRAGVVVVPVTAASAGWCDQMARMWPVDEVIGENGGFFFRRSSAGHELERWFWPPDCEREAIAQRLAEIGRNVGVVVPEAQFAQDHPFRLTSVAFSKPSDPGLCEAILAILRASGARVTVNNLWVLGWLGDYDKLAMTRRVMMQVYGLDIEVDREAVLYVGDSTNDGPMFSFFRHTVGVSTVIDCLPQIPRPPAWITRGPGGAGFVEVADAVLRSRDPLLDKH